MTQIGELEPRLGMSAATELVEREEHPRGADVEVLHRLRGLPPVPVVGRPEELRAAQRLVGVGHDLSDRGADALLVPGLVRERFEGLGPVQQRGYATSRTRAASASARSFFRPWCSIWRMRSRVTLNARPTSSSVRGCCPSSP
jgi:hypothetical protein